MTDTGGGSPLLASPFLPERPYADHTEGCVPRYTHPMWVWGLSAVAVVIVGGVLRALAKRRVDPGEGLSVSNAWVVGHRAAREDWDR